jgi:hypothetical protein
MHDRTITWCAAIMWLALAIFCLAGCFVRTIYVPDGKAVRLRQTIRNAKVWVIDADGQPVAGTMDLPEGWYCLDAPPEE